MILVILTALLAVSEAANIEKRHISPFNTRKSRGLFSSFGIGSHAVPSGGYTNDDLGVVVDAVAPGTRTSGLEPTGLGGPRTSYGSLDSKVGDAAFKVGGGAVKGTASGIGSLFGLGIGQEAHIGLPGIGFGSGSSSVDVVGKKPTGAQVTGFGVSKTTYESIHPTGGDVALGVENAAVKGGATGSGSILSSGSSQAKLGLPGIGFGSGSSSLDVVGAKPTGAQATGFGVSKTTFESIHPTGGDVALGVENAAVKGGTIGSGSILSSGSSQAKLGLPGIGFGSGSSSLDVVGAKPTGAQVTGFGVSKTTFESIHPTGGDVALGVENAAVKGGTIGSGSILSSGSSQAKLGLPGIGFGSRSSSLDVVGEKPTGVPVTGFGVSKTTFESIHPAGGDLALGITNSAVKGGATGSGSILSSGSSQAKLGLPGIGFGSGSSSLDAVGAKPTGAQATGFGVSKTTFESIHPTGGDVALGVENAAVKGGTIGSGSILSSGSSQANLGLPGIGFGSGSSSLDVAGEKTTGAQVTGFDVSKTTYESIHPTGGDVASNIKKASVKETPIGVGSIFGSGKEVNVALLGGGIESKSSSVGLSEIKTSDAKVSSLDVSKSSQIKATGAEITDLGKSKTSFESINSKGGDAALNIGNEEVKGGSAGISSVFDTSSGQEAKIGLTGIGVVPASSAVDVSGKVTGPKVMGFDVSKTTYESIDSAAGDAALNIEKAAVNGGTSISGTGQVGSGISSSELVKGYEGVELSTKGGDSEIASVFGSSKQIESERPSFGLGSGVISSGIVEGYENDKIHAQKFANNAALSTRGDFSGVSSVFGSGSSQKANTGAPNVGVIPGCSLFKTSGVKTTGAELTSFDLSKTSHSSIGSKVVDAAITTADASLKVSPPGVDSLFGSGIGQNENVKLPGTGVLPGVSSSVVGVEGYKNDKSHAQKFELENGIALNPPSIAVETLTSQKQNAKEESAGHVLDGSYNVQNNNDKSDNSKCNGEENRKLSINSGDSILKPNLVGQGSAAVRGSFGNGQSLSSAGQSIENKFNGFGLNGQTETQNKPELLYDVGKIGVTGVFQTPSSYGVNQKSTFHKTQHFGVPAEEHGESNVINHQSSVSTSDSTSSVRAPNPGQQVICSTKDNDGSSATFGSGITNIFNTGNFNRAGQKSEDSKYGSYFLTNPFYPGYKVVDNRQKLSGYEGVQFSTNSSPLKAAPLVNFQGLHFPIKNAFSFDLNTPIISPEHRQHQGLTSSHHNVITQTYVPSFTSVFRKPSTNFGQLSSNQGSFSSNRNLDSFFHKSTDLSDQKPLVQSQSNQKSFEFSGLQTQFGSTSGTEFLKKPLTIGILTPTPAVFEKKPEAKSISNISSGSQNNQFGFPFSSINNAKSVTTHSSSSSYNSRSEGQSTQKSQSNIKPFGSSQSTGFSSSQTQFGSTFGSHSGLNSQKVVGSQVQKNSQKDDKKLGSQDSFQYSQQSQYTLIPGSQVGKKPESTGTISHTFPVVGLKTTVSSQTGSANEKAQFGFSSSLLNSKPGSTQSIFSSNGGSKGQSVQSSQISVKPFGSSQSTGFGSSQTQFGSTFGSQSRLNSQKVVGPISSTTSQVQQNSQKDLKQSGLQDSLKTQFGSTFGSQSGLNSQKVVGSQVQKNSQKDDKKLGSQDSFQYSQQSQYTLIPGSQVGKKPESTGTISHTFPVVGLKTTVSSQTGSANEKAQFGFSSSLLNSKPGSTQSIFSSNGGSKGQSVQSSQISVKPFGSSQSTGFGSSQTQFGSTFGSQSRLNSQKVVGPISSTTSQVQQNSQKDLKQSGLQDSLKTQFGSTFGSQSGLNSQKAVGSISSTTSQIQQNSQKDAKQSQDSHKYSQQFQYSSLSGSQFGKKSESTGTISHTFPVVGQKTTVSSQSGSANEKNQFGFSSRSFNSKPGSIQSSSSSFNGGTKNQSVQTSQSNIKPFGSPQSTGFSSSQTQFGSTFGSHSGLNSQKVVGSQVQKNSQKDDKKLGSQDSFQYSKQSQYTLIPGSQVGKKPESTGTISHTFPVVGLKTTVSSQTGSANEKARFGFSSSLLNSKPGSTQSISSSNGGSKGQSVQSSQISVKPFGSSQNTGFSSSQTQFGSTFGSQSRLNSQKVVGSISSTTSQVQQNSQKDLKQSGLRDSLKTQFGSTFGSQSGSNSQKAVGSTSSTTSQVQQNSQKDLKQSGLRDSLKTQFGSTFGSQSRLNSQKVVGSISSTTSQVQQNSQKDLKQSGLRDRLKTQFGSTFGSQSGLNSQKAVGSISSRTSQIQQNSQKDAKQSQDSHKYSQQFQYSSLSGSQFGKKPESTGTISHTFPVVGQKTTVSSQSGSANEKNQFGFSSSSFNSQPGSTQSSSSSFNDGTKDQSVQTSQSNVKPFGSSQNTGSGFLQTQFGSTFGSQSGLNSQKVVGSISSTTSQVQQNSQKDVKQSGLQDSLKYSQQSQYTLTPGSQVFKKSESTGTISPTFPVVGLKTTVSSQSGSANEKAQFGFSSSSLNSKPESTQSISSSIGGSKGQSVQSPQISVKPFGSSHSTGFGSSQTQFGSTFGSQNRLNSQKVVGSISSTTSQVQQNSQKDVKQSGLQDSLKTQFGSTFGSQSGLNSQKVVGSISSTTSQVQQNSLKDAKQSQDSHKYSQQFQYSSLSGSQLGKKPESTGTISHTFPVVGQKTTVSSQSGSTNEKNQFGFSSSSFNSKPGSTQSSSSSFNGGTKDQSVQTSQSNVKPFGFSQNTGSGSLQTQFGSTFGSQSGLNPQKVVGSISSTTSQVQQNSQKDVKQSGLQDSLKTQFGSTFGSQSGLNSQKVVGSISSTTSQVQQYSLKGAKQSQDSHKYSQHFQYSSSSGSQFGKKPESTGTISHTFPVVGQKTTVSSQSGSTNEKNQFGFSSSSFNSKTGSTQSSSSSFNGGTKDQLVQTSQSNVKPFGSSQNTGSGFLQTQFGSTFGSQSGLNSQKVVGSISSTTSQVQQNFQKDVKHLGLQDSFKYSQQSQYNLTPGSQVGKKTESTGTISHTFPVVGLKTTVSSQSGSANEKAHFGFSSSSLNSKLGSTQSISSSNDGSKGQSVQSSQISVKPFGSSQSTGFGSSQTQFGSTFGSQGRLNFQKVVGSISSTTSQVQQNSQKDVKQSGLHDSLKTQFGSTFGSQSGLNSQKVVGSISSTTSQVQQNSLKDAKQFQYSSLSGSQYGKKLESTGTIFHTFPVVGQKTTVSSQSGSPNEKTQFGLSSSFSNSKPGSTQSSSSSYNGGTKDQSVQTSQSNVKPFGSSQNIGSGFLQTQFGSTFGSQSGLNSQKVVGSISSTTSQVQQNFQKDVKQSGLQDSLKYSQQSKYSLTSGSQFGKEPESTGTISHTFPVVGLKTTVSSQSGSANEKTQFGFSSSSLNSKPGSTQSISSPYNGGSKGQSVQSSQINVKPFGSSQSTGFGSSQTQVGSTFGSQGRLNSQKIVGSISSTTSQVQQNSQKDVKQSGLQDSLKTQFGSTFGSQSGLNSQKVVGSISSTTSQVQRNSQKDVKQSGLQDSLKYSQQSQYSSTSGSQFGKKPESTGTISQTFPVVGQKTTLISQKSSSNEKPHFGFTSSSLTSAKSVTTQSSSLSNNGGTKDQSVLRSQSSVKPFGSSQHIEAGFLQTQFGSTFGSQSGLTSQKAVGSISSLISQVQQNSQKDSKQSGSQDSNPNSQQSQYSSTTGSHFGKKPESTATISHTFPVIGQKKTGSHSEKVGIPSSSLNSEKSGSAQRTSSLYNGKPKGQSVQSFQLSEKPIGSSQSIGSSFSQTQLGSSFGTSSGHSQKVLGTTNSVLVQPISEYRKKPFDSQPNYNTYQQSQYGSTTGTEVKSLPESSLSHISTVVGQKSLGTLQTGSGNEDTQFGKLASSLLIKKSQSTESNSFSVDRVLKDQAEQTGQLGSKPFVYPQTTGSSFSKTHHGSIFGSPYDKQSFGRHSDSYQDTLLGLVTGSQGLSGQIHSVKPYSYSQITGSGLQQPHLSFSLRDLLNHKPQSTFSKSFSQSYTSQGYNTANKPFDIIPTPLHSHSGVGIGQNLQPFGGSLTQTVHKQTKVFGLTPSIFDQSVSKLANTAPGAQNPISVTEKSSELASFIGKGETFGGPRDPPSFDIKTGYHY